MSIKTSGLARLKLSTFVQLENTNFSKQPYTETKAFPDKINYITAEPNISILASPGRGKSKPKMHSTKTSTSSQPKLVYGLLNGWIIENLSKKKKRKEKKWHPSTHLKFLRKKKHPYKHNNKSPLLLATFL
ncbi:unnamed protein product, partial [Bubo scandiacus]